MSPLHTETPPLVPPGKRNRNARLLMLNIASVELLRTLLSAETAREQRATRLADVLMHQDICYMYLPTAHFTQNVLLVQALS